MTTVRQFLSSSFLPRRWFLAVAAGLSLSCLVPGALAQGTVRFNNSLSQGGVVVAPVYGPNTANTSLTLTGNPPTGTPAGAQDYSGCPLVGSCGQLCQYGAATTLATLLAAPGADVSEVNLLPANPTTTFRTGTAAGFVTITTATFNNVPKDAPVATIQMVAWDNASGLYPFWGQARVAWEAGLIAAGKSPKFNLTNLGGDVNVPPDLTNLVSFNLHYICTGGDAINGVGPPSVNWSTNGVTFYSSQTVPFGARVNVSCSAGGSGPLFLQWRFQGTNIPGATAFSDHCSVYSDYVRSPVQFADAGPYDYVVTNSFGSQTSAVTTLTVACLLNVSANGAGTVLKSPDQQFYGLATTVNLTAVPFAGWAFDHWSGDASGSANPLNVVMTTNKSITANFVVPPATCSNAPSGLVSWWAAENDASDVMANNPGTLQNNVTFAPGKVGQAFSFDGVSGHQVTLNSSTSLSRPWTVECWVNRQDSPEVSALLLSDGSTALKLEQYPNTRKVGFTQYTVGDYPFNYTAPVGTWVHLAFVGNSANVQLYVNGVLQDTVAPGINLGMGQIGSACKGLVDEMSVYNRALSATEIQNIYTAGSAGKCRQPACAPAPSGLVSWWPGAGNANDLIGTNNGTLGAPIVAGKVGQAFSFNGVNQAVVVPSFVNTLPTNEITVEFWQKADSVKSQYTLDLSGFDAAHDFGVSAPASDGKVYFEFGNASGGGQLSYTPTNSILGSWQHFACVASQSGNFMKIYRNGVLEAQKTGMTPYTQNVYVNDLWLGGDSSHAFGGRLDEVSIYNRALSDAEILAIYNAGSAGKCLSPVYITSVSRSGNNVSLSWLSQKGMKYHVQAKTDLSDPAWADYNLAGEVTATGPTASVTVGSVPTQRFFRVVMFR